MNWSTQRGKLDRHRILRHFRKCTFDKPSKFLEETEKVSITLWGGKYFHWLQTPFREHHRDLRAHKLHSPLNPAPWRLTGSRARAGQKAQHLPLTLPFLSCGATSRHAPPPPAAVFSPPPLSLRTDSSHRHLHLDVYLRLYVIFPPGVCILSLFFNERKTSH